jgi:hypothetical protein
VVPVVPGVPGVLGAGVPEGWLTPGAGVLAGAAGVAGCAGRVVSGAGLLAGRPPLLLPLLVVIGISEG